MVRKNVPVVPKYPIDPDTGLPRLNEGEFWRITQWGHSYEYKIAVMWREEKKTLFGTRQVEHQDGDRWTLFNNDSDTAVYDAAVEALELAEFRREERAAKAALGNPEGDYPPRRVGGGV